MSERELVDAIWPLFGLVISTPRLELRVSAGEDLVGLTRAARSIQPPNEPRFQTSWLYDPSPQMERQFLQHYWRGLANWRPDNWHLRFVVYREGKPIGMQSLWAKDYGVVRLVETGSWLSLDHQGHGYGTEMRAGVLELAFAQLGALEAHMDYIDGNVKAAAVSRKLGYEDNGQRLVARGDGRTLKHYMRLDRARWHEHRMPGCVVRDVEPCLELFGVR